LWATGSIVVGLPTTAADRPVVLRTEQGTPLSGHLGPSFYVFFFFNEYIVIVPNNGFHCGFFIHTYNIL
jgi:hypothetical protein